MALLASNRARPEQSTSAVCAVAARPVAEIVRVIAHPGFLWDKFDKPGCARTQLRPRCSELGGLALPPHLTFVRGRLRLAAVPDEFREMRLPGNSA